MTLIRAIAWTYGTHPAIVEGMLQDVLSPQASFRGRTADPDPLGKPTSAWLRWRPKRPARPQVLSIAELAECTCPELCDRDHANE